MKRIRSAAAAGMFLGAAALTGLCASAQDVTIVGAPCTLNVRTSLEEGAQTQAVETDHFTIFAQAGEEYMLIRTGTEDEYVSKAELQALSAQLECDRFPQVSSVTPLAQGASGEAVMALQQSLVDLGLLEGKVDGAYGRGTAGAVQSYQSAHGLEATGSADVYTLLLLAADAEGLDEAIEIATQSYENPEDKFPQIAGNTDADLSRFLNAFWAFSFDVFEEKGTIDPSLHIGAFSVDAPEVDQIQGDVSVKVIINKDEESGRYVLTPALVVDTEGAYRPYLQGAVFTGETAARLEGGVSTGEIAGVFLKESGYVPLTEEAAALLKSGQAQAVRLIGNNTSYDVVLEYDAEKMAEFMEACETLLLEEEQ